MAKSADVNGSERGGERAGRGVPHPTAEPTGADLGLTDGTKLVTNEGADAPENAGGAVGAEDAAGGAADGNKGRGKGGGRKGKDRTGDGGDGWLARLFGYILRYKRIVLVASGCSIAIAGIGVVVPLVQRTIIDGVILRGSQPVLPWACALIGIALLNFVVSRTRRFLGGSIGIEVQNDLRRDVFDSLSRLDGRGQDSLETGQIVSRSSSDINMVSQLIGMGPMMAGTILMFFSSLVAMLFLSPELTLVGLAVAPALLGVNTFARRKLFPATWDAQQKTGALAGVVESAVTGVRVVKGFGQEAQEVDKLDRAATSLFGARLRSVRLTARYNPTLSA
ncbi:ABC transporter ATP-binding protein, partial [Actinospica durhamensis]